MTTRIKIENPRDNKHSINIWKGDGISSDDHVAQLPPGDHYVCHVWEGIRLIIGEIPNKLKETK
jgi:hypothetical protein